jgi:hypothetical protein
MKKLDCKLHWWIVATALCLGVVLHVQAQSDDPVLVQTVSVSLTSPPNGLTLVGPVNIPLIAKVEGVESGAVAVEFSDGDLSLGLVDSPFNVLPGGDSEEEMSSSGIYSLTWADVPVGSHSIIAKVWLEGVLVVTSDSASFDVVLLDEQAEVNLLVSDPIASEDGGIGADTGEILVERSGRTDSELVVFFEWAGTAVFGEDYRALSGMVTIPSGESRASIGIQPMDDSLVEGDEKVVLRLLPPVCIDVFPPPVDCYLVGRNSEGTVTIRDNDQGTVNLPPFVFLTEPLAGQTFREGENVTLVAHAWDMDGSVDLIEFYEGDRLLGSVPVVSDPDGTGTAPVDDGSGMLPVPPSRNIVSFTWDGVSAGRYSLSAKAIDDANVGTESPAVAIGVVGVETLPVVTIEALDDQATEGRSVTPGRPTRGDVATFVVKRSGGRQGAIVVGLRIEGTATNGRDYSRIPERVTIPANTESIRVEVVAMDDREVEGTETVLLVLRPSDCQDMRGRNNRCYVVGRKARAQVEILDDERSLEGLAPSVAIVRPADGSLFNDSQTINLVAEAGDRDGRVVAVEFFANGESIGGVRARGNGRQTSRFFQLKVKKLAVGRYEIVAVATDDDGRSTKSESVRFGVGPNLVRAVVSVVAFDGVAAEVETPSLGGRETDVSESRVIANTATFIVARTGLIDVPLSVQYRLSGTAKNGVDYRELSGTVELAAGETRARVTVLPIDDAEVEKTEGVIIELLPPVCIAIFPPPADCYTLGRSKEASARIRDNERTPNQRPRIEIVKPGSNEEFVALDRIQVQAKTKDEDGFVQEVSFYANERLLGGVKAERDVEIGAAQTFDFVWRGAGPGKYELEAVAVDNMGRVSRSEPVTISVISPVIRRTVVSVEAIDAVAAETVEGGASPVDVGVIRFSRQGDLSVPVEVSYRIGGNAVNGRDYTRVGRAFVFEAGEASVDLVIEPIDDSQVEGTETVEVALMRPFCIAIFPPPPACYELAEAATATVRINDNDLSRNLLPRVAIVQPRTRSVFHQPAEVEVRVEAVDRDGWIGHVGLFSGENLVAEQSINFFREPDPGIEQHFTLLWGNAPIGEHRLTAVVTDDQGGRSRSRTVTVSVVGELELPVVTAFARDAFASEPAGNRPANKATVRIRRTGKTDEELVVRYEVKGTAENGADYEGLSGSITILAKKRWATLTIVPLGDQEDERTETVVVRLLEGGSAIGRRAYDVGRPAQAGVVIQSRNQVMPGSRRLADGTVHVCIPAPNGKTFRIEAGSNLVDWDVVGTNTVIDEAIHIVDTESSDTEARFFRIVPDIDTEPEDQEN